MAQLPQAKALGRTLAMRLDLDYLDTGKLPGGYHAALASGVDIDASDLTAGWEIATNLDLSQPFTSELRTTDVGEAASKVAALAEVRQALLRKQREFAENPPHGKGAVLDGRDIGTVVLPDADAKFYIDAAADIRANRRHLELVAAGEAIEFPEVLSDLIKRDRRDKPHSSTFNCRC